MINTLTSSHMYAHECVCVCVCECLAFYIDQLNGCVCVCVCVVITPTFYHLKLANRSNCFEIIVILVAHVYL